MIVETKDIVYIGIDFPNEYKGSRYTKHLKGRLFALIFAQGKIHSIPKIL